MNSNDRINELKGKWNEALLAIFKRTFASLDLAKPSFPSEELVAKVPYALEEATRSAARKKQGQHGFVIISAPSGGGKGAIGQSLETMGFSRLPRFTTRERRPEEIEGKSYYFISRQQFLDQAGRNEFLPWTETHNELRGTSRPMLTKLLEKGAKFYLEGSAGVYLEFLADPDVQKANPLSVFLLPPSFEILEQRLRQRPDSLSEDEIAERLAKAVEHLGKTQKFPYDAYYVNDIIERTGRAIAEDF